MARPIWLLHSLPRRFSLRTLLVTVFLASIALYWWYSPVSVKEPWGPASGLTLEYKTRRNWDGRKHYVGPVLLRYENGHVAAVSKLDVSKAGTFFVGDKYFDYWHEDGRRLDWTEWFMYISTDYIPRQMDGKPINMEPAWRRLAAESKKKNPLPPELRADERLPYSQGR
jgi:hypothetical protein